MKKFGLPTILGIIIVCAMILGGCGGTATTTPAPTTTKATTVAPSTAPTTTAVPTQTINKGGTLRIIAGSVPKNLGYDPEKAPADRFQMLPVYEHLCEWGPSGGILVPGLATSWELSHTTNTITFHLRQGVKFSDGTPFNAEAVRWNVQLSIDNRTGSGTQLIESLEVKDDYTFIYHMKSFDWQTTQSLGLTCCISPTSFKTAGGKISADSTAAADVDARKAWARANAVGTGAFTVSEWVRDDHITFVKNPNYWGAPKPYLDKIIVTAIADTMVASAKLQAGEADMWSDTSSMNDIIALKAKNFTLVPGPGMFYVLLFSDVDPASPLSNIKVRAAIEYALDRPTMAKTIGQGLFEPFTQMASSNGPGYVKGYDPRPFNTEKAKQLLTEAGYPKGFTLKILGSTGGSTNDVMALFTYYLGLANITVQPDVADLGRYSNALFGGAKGGWDGLCYTASGINPDASEIFTHYGPNPLTFRTTNIYKSPLFTQYCNEAIDPKYSSAAEAMPQIQAAIKQAGEDCLFVPLWRSYEASIVWPYVHTEYPKIHGVIWHPENDWMDKH
jgi:peptide/nickel transport system substrate-binding protein